MKLYGLPCTYCGREKLHKPHCPWQALPENAEKVITLRLPKHLRDRIKDKAHNNKVSMNQYLVSVLGYQEDLDSALENLVSDFVNESEEDFNSLEDL